MIINKVINNNVLSTHDENNREIVLMGKGIGFQKKVGDEVAEDKIEKKFVLDSEDEVGKFSELIERVCEIKSVNRHSMISDGAVSS